MGCIEQIWCLNNLRKYGTVYLQYVHQNITGQNNDMVTQPGYTLLNLRQKLFLTCLLKICHIF